MICLPIHETADDAAIEQAVTLLRHGGIIVYPTETFYAIGAKFDMPASLNKIYTLKKRPPEKAMPVIIGNRENLSQIVSSTWLRHMPSSAAALMDSFWPGPLTLLLPALEGLSEYLTADTGKIAVRIPGESFALHLAKQAGFPITATSANISGIPPADDAEMVAHYFKEGMDLLIDGGKTPGGLPSTIIDFSGDTARIVREGAIRKSAIKKQASVNS